MDKPTDRPETMSELRRRAEQQLAAQPASPAINKMDEKKLLHELQVQRIVLEMQNATLQEAHRDAELALQHYSKLFAFAPVAYFTLTRHGIIQETNFSAGILLGTESASLTGQNFTRWIPLPYRSMFVDLALCEIEWVDSCPSLFRSS